MSRLYGWLMQRLGCIGCGCGCGPVIGFAIISAVTATGWTVTRIV